MLTFLGKGSTAVALLFLAGCAHEAPMTFTKPIEVRIPVPIHRDAPTDLLEPAGLEAPTWLPPGQGDYCMTRADVEKTIDALRTAAARQAKWKAWAQ